MKLSAISFRDSRVAYKVSKSQNYILHRTHLSFESVRTIRSHLAYGAIKGGKKTTADFIFVSASTVFSLLPSRQPPRETRSESISSPTTAARTPRAGAHTGEGKNPIRSRETRNLNFERWQRRSAGWKGEGDGMPRERFSPYEIDARHHVVRRARVAL